MATILQFRSPANCKAPRNVEASEQQPSLKSARLLFFTGVRYERHGEIVDQPAQPKRKRQPRQSRQAAPVEQTGG